jgi:hypothetical protein
MHNNCQTSTEMQSIAPLRICIMKLQHPKDPEEHRILLGNVIDSVFLRHKADTTTTL